MGIKIRHYDIRGLLGYGWCFEKEELRLHKIRWLTDKVLCWSCKAEAEIHAHHEEGWWVSWRNQIKCDNLRKKLRVSTKLDFAFDTYDSPGKFIWLIRTLRVSRGISKTDGIIAKNNTEIRKYTAGMKENILEWAFPRQIFMKIKRFSIFDLNLIFLNK